jgi:hypothetical protein
VTGGTNNAHCVSYVYHQLVCAATGSSGACSETDTGWHSTSSEKQHNGEQGRGCCTCQQPPGGVWVSLGQLPAAWLPPALFPSANSSRLGCPSAPQVHGHMDCTQRHCHHVSVPSVARAWTHALNSRNRLAQTTNNHSHASFAQQSACRSSSRNASPTLTQSLLLPLSPTPNTHRFNKYILAPDLGGFPFPLTLTSVHMLVCSAVSWLLVRLQLVEVQDMPVETYTRLVGCCWCGTVSNGGCVQLRSLLLYSLCV